MPEYVLFLFTVYRPPATEFLYIGPCSFRLRMGHTGHEGCPDLYYLHLNFWLTNDRSCIHKDQKAFQVACDGKSMRQSQR